MRGRESRWIDADLVSQAVAEEEVAMVVHAGSADQGNKRYCTCYVYTLYVYIHVSTRGWFGKLSSSPLNSNILTLHVGLGYTKL